MVQADEITVGIDFSLRQGGAIQGYVYDETTTTPLVNFPVTVDYSSDTPLQNIDLRTNDQGFYQCDYLQSGGLPPRDYYIRAHHGSAFFSVATPTAPPGEPTYTPLPSQTPTPNPTGTIPPNAPEVNLELSQETFHKDDLFLFTCAITNPGPESYLDQPLVILLDVYGSYYWYPGWTEMFNFHSLDLESEPINIEVFRFVWPDIQGSASGLFFYGALLSQNFSQIVGHWDWVTFGWQ